MKNKQCNQMKNCGNYYKDHKQSKLSNLPDRRKNHFFKPPAEAKDPVVEPVLQLALVVDVLANRL